MRLEGRQVTNPNKRREYDCGERLSAPRNSRQRLASSSNFLRSSSSPSTPYQLSTTMSSPLIITEAGWPRMP